MDTIKNKIYLPVDGGPISNDRPPRPPPLPPLPPPRPPRPLPPPRPLKDIADYVYVLYILPEPLIDQLMKSSRSVKSQVKNKLSFALLTS